MSNNQTTIEYNEGINEEKNWVISETEFLSDFLGKTESIFVLGNGYMGLRSASEEKYPNETRGLFVAGTFNKAEGEHEVSELPNAADSLNMEIYLNGERFNLNSGKVIDYNKKLNLKNAELIRTVKWESPKKYLYHIEFKRIVSLKNKHITAQEVIISPLNNDLTIKIHSGIDGHITNSGTQHFIEGEKRFFDKSILMLDQRTSHSEILFTHYAKHNFNINGNQFEPNQLVGMDRRVTYVKFDEITINQNESFTIEKISGVYTSRDNDYSDDHFNDFNEIGDYKSLFQEHTQAWQDQVWNKYNYTIAGDDFDQLAIRFAIYHLVAMTPSHDNRMSIGAKGLSGEGYKGHAFWDNEIFILPFYITANPKIARQLLEYRYLTLNGARKKAVKNGYEGAMFPWESAWLDDGEVTPLFGAADIITGKRTPIWSGIKEQHISADIAYATWQYYQYTSDHDFMDKFGYELIFDTAIFWQSRLEWNEDKKKYFINDVVGPDEYKEHINNNAFTNYMAYWTIVKAMELSDHLKTQNVEIWSKLNQRLNLDMYRELWEEKNEKIYLPKPNTDGILPQDDTYLSKKEIDLTKYKQAENVGLLFDDYNLEQVNSIQVSKQADIVILMYLLGDYFDLETKIKNFHYYENRTLHDSSLSLATHSIMANIIGDNELAYKMFKEGSLIDLGPAMNSSNAGIHSASLGGILQMLLFGFAGIKIKNEQLEINPKLPKEWQKLEFPFVWRGNELYISITHSDITISNLSYNAIELYIKDQWIQVKKQDRVNLVLN